jgi:hypothetical protein
MLYFQTSKLEGVNPPFFEIYISILVSRLGEIEGFYPLDKILGKARFWGLWELLTYGREMGAKPLNAGTIRQVQTPTRRLRRGRKKGVA